MKKILFPAILGAVLFTSCKKDSDSNAEKILFQQMEVPNAKYLISYNEQDQPIQFVIQNKNDGGTFIDVVKVNYVYNDGKPVSADFYLNIGKPELLRTVAFSFNVDGQNKIASVSRKKYTEEGNEDVENRDTLFFNYDGNKRIVSFKRGNHGIVEDNWTFNAEGNLVFSNWTKESNINAERTSQTYEHKYDNGINPFRTNGVGVMLFATTQNLYLRAEQLLSQNNPTFTKEVFKREVKDELQRYIEQYRSEKTQERTFAYDAAKLLTQANVSRVQNSYEYGQLSGNSSDSYEEKYTCVKK